METISVQIPDDVFTRLRELVQITGRSKDFHILEAIQDYLDDLEDLHIAEQRLADIHSGHSKTNTLEEVMKRYGMES